MCSGRRRTNTYSAFYPFRGRKDAPSALRTWLAPMPHLEPGHLLHFSVVAGPGDPDTSGGFPQCGEVVGGQVELCGADVLSEALQSAGAGDGCDRGALGQQRGQGDLGRWLRGLRRPP
jgi:hypothetical protein